jgi:hypothetical protein
VARAALFTHQLGWEVRLLVGSQLEVVQTQVCRDREEVLGTGEQWKQAMIRKDGNDVPYLTNRNAPSKDCTVSGCVGRMKFHPRQKEAAGLHTLEWPWQATWACQANATHIEIATAAEEKALSGRSWWR